MIRPSLFTLSAAGQQDILSLSLDEMLELADARNTTIQKGRIEYEIATLTHKLSREWWIPSLKAGASLHQQNGITMNSDGRFF